MYSPSLLVACLLVFHSNVVEAKVGVNNIKMCTTKNYAIKVTDIGVKPVEDDVELKFSVNLPVPIDNDNFFKVSVGKIIGDKTRPIINVRQKGACNALMNYGGDIYKKGAKLAKVPHPDSCPIEKGNYVLNWYRVKLSEVPIFRLVPTGKFKVSFSFSKGSDELFCVEFEAEKS